MNWSTSTQQSAFTTDCQFSMASHHKASIKLGCKCSSLPWHNSWMAPLQNIISGEKGTSVVKEHWTSNDTSISGDMAAGSILWVAQKNLSSIRGSFN